MTTKSNGDDFLSPRQYLLEKYIPLIEERRDSLERIKTSIEKQLSNTTAKLHDTIQYIQECEQILEKAPKIKEHSSSLITPEEISALLHGEVEEEMKSLDDTNVYGDSFDDRGIGKAIEETLRITRVIPNTFDGRLSDYYRGDEFWDSMLCAASDKDESHMYYCWMKNHAHLN